MEGEELRKLKKSVFILLGIFIGVWILLKIPFEKKINQTITAGVYINGVEVQETTVVIDGVRSNYLFSDEQDYNGQFIIEYYERTGRKGMNARIRWNKKVKQQHILYYQNATFPSLEINHELLIDKNMEAFALGFGDGTIIATSEEMYQSYKQDK
jgi:hypothetical protein